MQAELRRDSEKEVSPDEQKKFQKLLIGKWGVSNDEGKTFWGYENFTSENELITSWQQGEKTFTITNEYELIGDTYCTEALESTSPGIPIRFGQCVEIIKIDASNLVIKSYGNNQVTLYRVSDE